MTPMQMFAVSLAYMIDADKMRPAEEKAEFLSILGKHVTRGEFTDRGLAELSKFAFDFVEENDLDTFLTLATPKLSNLQRAAIYINALETMLVDGTVREIEQTVLKKFQDAFQIDRETVLAVREVIYIKNDTRMFLYPEHPRNAPTEYLAVRYHRSRES
jgi:uncharacterized tellurite resistance protein B-like protein